MFHETQTYPHDVEKTWPFHSRISECLAQSWMANISTDNLEHAVRQQHSNHIAAQKNGTKNTLPLSRWLSLLVKSLRIYILIEGKQIARHRAEQKYLTPQTTANEYREQPQTLLFFIALQLQCCRLVSMCMGRCISRFA